jgi:hypothetical protein
MWIGEAFTRGGFTSFDGTISSPATAASSTPAGAGAEVTFIASRRSQVTTLQTNSPVRSTLASESLEPSGGPSVLRPPGLNITQGGSPATPLKKL